MKKLEKLDSSKFNKLAENEIFGKDKIFGGAAAPGDHTHTIGNTHNYSSTWLGLDDDNTVNCDAICDGDKGGNR